MPAHHYEVLRRAGASEANASTSTDRTAYHEVVPAQRAAARAVARERSHGLLRARPRSRAPREAASRSCAPSAASATRTCRTAPSASRSRRAVSRRPSRAPPDDRPPRSHPGRDARRRARVLSHVVRAGERDARDRRRRRPRRDRRARRSLLRQLPGLARARRARCRPRRSIAGPIRETVTDKFAALTRIHRAWHGPLAFADDEPELDILHSRVVRGRHRRAVAPARLRDAARAARVGVDDSTAASAARSMSRSICAPAPIPRRCARSSTRNARAASTPLDRAPGHAPRGRRDLGPDGLSRRANLLQRYALYTGEPDGLAADLARYRAVTPASIDAAIARWLAPSNDGRSHDAT